jgi:hypothetical protein
MTTPPPASTPSTPPAAALRVLRVRRQVPALPAQRVYVREILVGLGVTAHHFFRNLGR